MGQSESLRRIVATPIGIAHPGESSSGGVRRQRTVVLTVVIAMLAALFTVVGAPIAANAAGNQPGVGALGDNTVYVYVQAGESLTIDGTAERISTVTQPDGTTHASVGTYGPATQDGVWTIVLTSGGANVTYDWSVDVVSANGSTIPGRTWSGIDSIKQPGLDQPGGELLDLRYWVVNDSGYIYEIELNSFNGINSIIVANSLGWTDEDCAPTYASHELLTEAPECGSTYRIFTEEPASDLPASAPSASGDVTIVPPLLEASDLVVDDLAFAPSSTGSAEGAFTYSLNPRFTGGYQLQVDVNGNGSYGDDVDRQITLGADGTGSYSYVFDGLDGNGAAIADCTTMHARINFDKLGEIHFVQRDVESRGGISITRLNGAQSPDSRISWDDTQLPTEREGTTDPLSATLIDSAEGVHGWPFDVNGWGNENYIDDWAYLPADFGTGEIEIAGRCLELEKTSTATEASRIGDTIEYSVKVTNTGDADYTEDQPAVFYDDLVDVLDDADYNGDASADTGPAPEFQDPSFLRWSGALTAGETVTMTYTVTLTSGGDGNVRNVAWVPGTTTPPGGTPPAPPACDPSDSDGRDPVTGESCGTVEYDLPTLEIEKVADTQELPEDGGIVTYTVTITNNGPGATTSDDDPVVDDLSAVLDDGELVTGSESATAGDVVFDPAAQTLSWTGALEADGRAVVTYQVRYDMNAAEGDHKLVNVVCAPASMAQDPQNACRQVEIPGPGLDTWKTVDPSSGSTVRAESEVTYTLHFRNTGGVPVNVASDDVLTQVLDDAQLTSDPTASDSDALTVSDIVDNRFTVTGTLAVGQEETVTYTVLINPDGERGDDRLGNFLVPEGEEPPTECVADEGELPNCTVNHVSDVTVTKSADPAPGSELHSDDTVTYTLTFSNASTNTDAAPEEIAYTDHMDDVLDDATLTDGPTSSDSALTARSLGSTIEITGALGSGEVATVTYSVDVKAYGDQGNHHLGNVVAITGEDPVCVDASDLCTSHEISSTGGLPRTGGTVEPGWLFAALLALGFGGSLLAASRRTRRSRKSNS
ncbi:DUF7507 domain-containing protein [Paramicrobacterium chengjingii]|uniref:DUF7927 domain-containing protein n=1 Tax=Paramicrobacterium chengjingii TaxID=2769067 RepID=UPI001420CFF7|nr:DUF11 domain-containing protein [Microbacterium chengjingii]